jgi:hypothetical protein
VNSFLTAGLGLLGNALQVIIPVVGLVVILVRTRGPTRNLGVAGCAVLAGVGTLQAFWIFIAPELYRAVGPSLLGVIGLGFAVISAVGLGLIIAAVCVRSPDAVGRQPWPGP